MAMDSNYDRMKELLEFDETKAGAKGLVDSGIKKIPRIFVDSPENLPKPSDLLDRNLKVPVIDFQGIGDAIRRKKIVDEVCEASETWGFFQVVNHGVPIDVLDAMMQGNLRFHELDKEIKAKFYSRDVTKKVKYTCNFLLFSSPVATWRDTFSCAWDESLDPEDLPSVCRKETLDFMKQVSSVAETVCELLSEALGLDPNYLRSINSMKSGSMLSQYYPPCPEPDRTLGTFRHTDPSLVTLLFQDDLGGLQVLPQGQWVPVAPTSGAMIVNIGDLLQLISNDAFKSVEHRVLASYKGPRLSTAMFFNPSINDVSRLYGPIREALSNNNPLIYQDRPVRDYMMCYTKKPRAIGESALSHFKL